MKVYLAGGLYTDWQQRVIDAFPGVKFFDPRNLQGLQTSRLVEEERAWLDVAEVVFAYVERSNPRPFGTCLEIGYARGLAEEGNPVTIILVDENAGSGMNWIRGWCNVAVSDFEDGLQKLGKVLGQTPLAR